MLFLCVMKSKNNLQKSCLPTRGSGRMKPNSSETWYVSREKGALKPGTAAIEKSNRKPQTATTLWECERTTKNPNLSGLWHRVAVVNNGCCLHNVCPPDTSIAQLHCKFTKWLVKERKCYLFSKRPPFIRDHHANPKTLIWKLFQQLPAVTQFSEAQQHNPVTTHPATLVDLQ